MPIHLAFILVESGSGNAIIEPFGRGIARKTEPLERDLQCSTTSSSPAALIWLPSRLLEKELHFSSNACLCPGLFTRHTLKEFLSTMSWRQSSVHMERALLERCPNTLLRRRVSEGFKVSDLALPTRGLRPITTIASPTSTTPTSTTATLRSPGARVPTVSAPRYTSLAEIIPSECASPVESVSSPRTPMRNELLEKAARAYLRPSDSFNKSRLNQTGAHLSSAGSCAMPWTQSFSRFLPRLSVITTALNPFHALTSAFQVFRFYVTGALSIQPAVATRTVSRSFSMPIQRMSYNHTDLSLR